MAYRAGVLGRHQPDGIIALGGDVPPDVAAGGARAHWPRILVGAGERDPWYTPAKVDHDVAFLRAAGVEHDVVRFDGAHQWTEEFRRAAGQWLDTITANKSATLRT